jgi:formate hydrogenlyase subunit 3/multisubunit Na+/H+ antiporter MnhD subunit
MNAPLIFIGLPIIFGLIFTLIRHYRQLTLWLAAFVCAGLGLFALAFPLGEVVPIGNLRPEIGTTFSVLGRNFILNNQDRTVLFFLFGIGFLWFLAAGFTWAHRFFAPFGMGIIAAFVAALAVQPILYSALFVEVAVLLSIPLLAPPGKPLKVSVQRFLIFQTLAMPFILFAGWLIGQGEINPSAQETLLRASAFLALGFAFMLAVFPFYSWMPQLSEETHPYPAGFILTLLPVSVLLIGLNFLNSIGWLRSSADAFTVLRLVGVIMVFTGGIWAAFQKNLARLLGYAVILETGFALVTLGLRSNAGFELFVAGLFPRVLGLFVFSMALGTMYNRGVDFRFPAIRAIGTQMPFATTAILLSLFSMGGLPLLASFPIRLDIFEQLSSIDIPQTVFVLLGSAGFLFAAVRVLAVMVIPKAETQQIGGETRVQRISLSIAIAALTLLGLFPGQVLPLISGVLEMIPLIYPLR